MYLESLRHLVATVFMVGRCNFMSNEGVVFVLYDLPTNDAEQGKEYRRFIKSIKKMAYRQLQESVYIKQLRNLKSANDEIRRLHNEAPMEGNVITFSMTMNQYKSMYVLRGDGIPMIDDFNAMLVV